MKQFNVTIIFKGGPELNVSVKAISREQAIQWVKSEARILGWTEPIKSTICKEIG